MKTFSEASIGHVQNMLEIAEGTTADVMFRSPTYDTDIANTLRRRIGSQVIEYARGEQLPVAYFEKGRGWVAAVDDPEYRLHLQPLSGATNFTVGQGFGVFPFGTLLSISKGPDHRYKNVVAAGAVELASGKSWTFDGTDTKEESGAIVRITGSPASPTPIYYDLSGVHPENISSLTSIFSLRHTGSTVGNLACMLVGATPAIVDISTDPGESGAIYGLVTGAGGVVQTLRGEPLAHHEVERATALVAGDRPAVEHVIRAISWQDR